MDCAVFVFLVSSSSMQSSTSIFLTFSASPLCMPFTTCSSRHSLSYMLEYTDSPWEKKDLHLIQVRNIHFIRLRSHAKSLQSASAPSSLLSCGCGSISTTTMLLQEERGGLPRKNTAVCLLPALPLQCSQ